MGKVPESLKLESGYFYAHVISGDPKHACQFAMDLAGNLQTSMEHAGISEYQESLKAAEILARRAWHEYSEVRNPGLAMQTISEFLKKVKIIVHDERFVTLRNDTYSMVS